MPSEKLQNGTNTTLTSNMNGSAVIEYDEMLHDTEEKEDINIEENPVTISRNSSSPPLKSPIAFSGSPPPELGKI